MAASNPDCEVCGQNHPFELPHKLLQAALAKKLVVFAGAGISTESRQVFPDTFAEEIAAELGGSGEGLSFPELMSAYEERFGRGQLLQQIRHRFDYMRGFPELLHTATRFHSELSTAFFLDQVVTTNWDTYFEEYAGANPIVIPEDYAFWDLEGRKVFKLHGSMHNLSTLVATTKDYDRCYRRLRSGTIGSTLKHLLATKRALFVGYSFGDPDLNRLLRLLKSELQGVLPRSYLVTPHGYDGTEFPQDRVIRTDGTFFIQRLKEAAADLNLMRPDAIYPRMARLARKATQANIRTAKLSIGSHPSVIHSLAYQNGLQHAFARIAAFETSGRYSNPHSTHLVVPSYEQLRRGAIRQRRYFDAAYIEGYMNGLISLDVDDETTKGMPLYFVWGSKQDLLEFQDFERELKRAPRLHKGATADAVRLTKDIADGLTVRHKPFLDGVEPV